MTAVQWLMENIDCTFRGEIKAKLNKALKIEKKQLKECWKDGFSFQSPHKNFEQYYNSVYNDQLNQKQ